MANVEREKQVLATMILRTGTLTMGVDGRNLAVVVPSCFRNTFFSLAVGYHTAIPIPDLFVDDWGMTGTLSFSRAPFFVRVPWTAVIALANSEGFGQEWLPDGFTGFGTSPEVSGAPMRTKTRERRKLPAGWRVVK